VVEPDQVPASEGADRVEHHPAAGIEARGHGSSPVDTQLAIEDGQPLAVGGRPVGLGQQLAVARPGMVEGRQHLPSRAYQRAFQPLAGSADRGIVDHLAAAIRPRRRRP
jgi:hypothetical protein